MSFTTFAGLKTAVSGALGRDPADVTYQLVTAEINSRLDVLSREETTTIAEAAEVSLPANFRDIVAVYRDTTPRTTLTPTSLNNIHRTYQPSGTPTEYAVVDDSGTKKLKLNRPGSASINLQIRYISTIDVLSADEDTNDILTKYPNVYFYGAMAHHATMIGDDRAPGWHQAFNQAIADAIADDTDSRSGGTPMPTAPGMTP